MHHISDDVFDAYKFILLTQLLRQLESMLYNELASIMIENNYDNTYINSCLDCLKETLDEYFNTL